MLAVPTSWTIRHVRNVVNSSDEDYGTAHGIDGGANSAINHTAARRTGSSRDEDSVSCKETKETIKTVDKNCSNCIRNNTTGVCWGATGHITDVACRTGDKVQQKTDVACSEVVSVLTFLLDATVAAAHPCSARSARSYSNRAA